MPLGRERLEFVQRQLCGIQEIVLPLSQAIGSSHSTAKHDHFVLLCPEDDKPRKAVIKRKQPAPQSTMKAYVIPGAVILVSVQFLRRRTWYFIRALLVFILCPAYLHLSYQLMALV